jgi:hypothetical protein
VNSRPADFRGAVFVFPAFARDASVGRLKRRPSFGQLCPCTEIIQELGGFVFSICTLRLNFSAPIESPRISHHPD